MHPTWLDNAVLYTVDIASFHDADGDGHGDLAGLEAKLDHIADLGATCIWLQPIFPSPRRDDGYDVADHMAVDERFGDLDDVKALLAAAHDRGLRVVIDLVVNHTSDQHRWFQRSRRDPAALERPYYVWRPAPEHDLGIHPVFPGVSDEVWHEDAVAGEWYLARFYPHEPELDPSCPELRAEIERIVAHWLDLGVDGFRIDAVPYLVQKASWSDARLDGHWFLQELHRWVERRNPDAIVIGEADIEPQHYDDYFDDGQVDGLFDFYLNNHLFHSLAVGDAAPLRAALDKRQRPCTGTLLQWVRNHDELDLERLEETDRDAVYGAFAPTDDEQIYGRGIRRRFPPMVDGDRERIELAYVVAFSLPGAPVLRYGEEIGMGDDLRQPERLAVRTAMQWTAAPNAGFSTATVEELGRPVVIDPRFAPDVVNVADQRADPSSLLQWFRALIRARRAMPELGTTWPEVLDAPTSVLALRYVGEHRSVICVANLGTRVEHVDVGDGTLAPLFPARIPSTEGTIELAPRAYAWFVTSPSGARERHDSER